MADILVVGAGLSGLTAAADLQAAGHDVVVVDKGHRPGGRMATRHIDDGTWDTGAQFLTARTDPFAAEVDRWQAAGVATTWFHGSPDAAGGGEADGGHARFRGAPTMRSIPEYLAGDLTVRCGVRLARLGHADGRWVGLDAHGAHLAADGVVLTPPAPQALALLEDTRVDAALTAGLRDVAYDPCWAVLVRPSTTPDLPDSGALRLADHPLHMVSDNHRKGVSNTPSVTLHASAARSRELFDEPGDRVGAALLADAAEWVTGEVVHTHRWRYAQPTGPGVADALATTVPGPLAVAGDGLAGGRVEGAWRSGREAARLLRERLA